MAARTSSSGISTSGTAPMSQPCGVDLISVASGTMRRCAGATPAGARRDVVEEGIQAGELGR